MANVTVTDRGGNSVEIDTIKVEQVIIKSLIDFDVPRTSASYNEGALKWLIDLGKNKHTITVNGVLSSTAGKSDDSLRLELLAIANALGKVDLTYKGITYTGNLTKLMINEVPTDLTSAAPTDGSKYSVILNWIEGGDRLSGEAP